MEDGINSSEVMQQYHELKKKHEKLVKEHDTYKSKVENKIGKSKKKIEQLFEKLKKQQDECVKPLIQEMKISSELLDRQNKQIDQNKKDIKMLHSILRMPAMCDQFQKALKRKRTAG